MTEDERPTTDLLSSLVFRLPSSVVMQDLAKLLILFGVIIILIGGALLLIGRVPFLGRLPGDFTFQSDGVTCFFPLATMIILSILLTILLNLALHLFHK
jgi:Protein of unknown function (DUF2905)